MHSTDVKTHTLIGTVGGVLLLPGHDKRQDLCVRRRPLCCWIAGRQYSQDMTKQQDMNALKLPSDVIVTPAATAAGTVAAAVATHAAHSQASHNHHNVYASEVTRLSALRVLAVLGKSSMQQ